MSMLRKPFEKLAEILEYLRENFTLLEIAMALIVIGLILGSAVLAGDLVHAAKIRAQVEQIKKLEMAFTIFQQKFQEYPGDNSKASYFFPGTINGNGNGYIDTQNAALIRWNSADELRQVFIQLAKASLMDRPYDGSNELGKGIPYTSYSNDAGIFIASSRIFDAAIQNEEDKSLARLGNNIIWLAACNHRDKIFNDDITRWVENCGVFPPNDLRQIDAKIDDGIPINGKLQGFGEILDAHARVMVPCVNEKGTYAVNHTEKSCQAMYVLN